MANWCVDLCQEFFSLAGFGLSAAVPWLMVPSKKDSFKCRRSYAFSENIKCKSSQSQIPLLMLPPPKEYSIRFFDISKCTTLPVNFRDHPYGGMYESGRYFSSRGWIIKMVGFMLDDTLLITLLHPFLKLLRKLPTINTLLKDSSDNAWGNHTFFLSKCIISSSNPDSLQILIIYGCDGKLGYARPGDQVWRKINTSSTKNFVDAIYYQNQFYAINSSSQIFAIKDVDTATQIAELPAEFIEDTLEYFYMVECDDDGSLFVISRRGIKVPPIHDCRISENCFRTLGFQVFKVHVGTNKWTKIKNLGNKSFFLGFNSSFSIDASNNPECKPNCIYFADDFMDCYWYLNYIQQIEAGGRDTGIYNMKDGSIEPLLKTNPFHPFNPLMWVERNS